MRGRRCEQSGAAVDVVGPVSLAGDEALVLLAQALALPSSAVWPRGWHGTARSFAHSSLRARRKAAHGRVLVAVAAGTGLASRPSVDISVDGVRNWSPRSGSGMPPPGSSRGGSTHVAESASREGGGGGAGKAGNRSQGPGFVVISAPSGLGDDGQTRRGTMPGPQGNVGNGRRFRRFATPGR